MCPHCTGHGPRGASPPSCLHQPDHDTHSWGPPPQSARPPSRVLSHWLLLDSLVSPLGGLQGAWSLVLTPLTVSSSPAAASSRCTPAAPSLRAVPVGGQVTSPSPDGQQLSIPASSHASYPSSPTHPTAPHLVPHPGSPLLCLSPQPRPHKHRVAGGQAQVDSPLLRHSRSLSI